MTARNNDMQWSNEELVHLLGELDRLQKEEIVPLSNDEVASIEETYQGVTFPVERDKRQRQHLEELREQWIDDTETIKSLTRYARERGLSPAELATRLKVSSDIVFQLEMRFIRDVPHRLCKKLAEELDLDIRTIYRYFSLPPHIEEMAASSKEKPMGKQTQSWNEAVAVSNMSKEDREYWDQ